MYVLSHPLSSLIPLQEFRWFDGPCIPALRTTARVLTGFDQHGLNLIWPTQPVSPETPRSCLHEVSKLAMRLLLHKLIAAWSIRRSNVFRIIKDLSISTKHYISNVQHYMYSGFVIAVIVIIDKQNAVPTNMQNRHRKKRNWE